MRDFPNRAWFSFHHPSPISVFTFARTFCKPWLSWYIKRPHSFANLAFYVANEGVFHPDFWAVFSTWLLPGKSWGCQSRKRNPNSWKLYTLSYNVKSPSSDPRQFLVTLNVYSKVLLHFYSVQQWQPSQRQCLYTCITYITLVHVLVLNVLSQSFSKLADLRFSKRWRALEDPLDESLFWSFLAKSKNQGFSAYLSLIN